MLTTDDTRDDWNRAAPAWIAKMVAGEVHRVGLLDPWMLDACGDVAGRDVIDLGCGEGRFARMLAGRGARVLGIDFSQAMIAAASRQAGDGLRFAVDDMQGLTVADGQFDLAVSYVTLVDVPDHRRAVAEAFRVLRPGGRLVVCNLAPMVTAGNRWLKTPEGQKVCFFLDQYLDESVREMPLAKGAVVRNFHRTLGNYLEAFVAGGFVLAALREPFPTAEQVAAFPDVADNLRVPLFQIFLLDKPR
jgi:SAM-dependent methyltransferase